MSKVTVKRYTTPVTGTGVKSPEAVPREHTALVYRGLRREYVPATDAVADGRKLVSLLMALSTIGGNINKAGVARTIKALEYGMGQCLGRA